MAKSFPGLKIKYWNNQFHSTQDFTVISRMPVCSSTMECNINDKIAVNAFVISVSTSTILAKLELAERKCRRDVSAPLERLHPVGRTVTHFHWFFSLFGISFKTIENRYIVDLSINHILLESNLII